MRALRRLAAGGRVGEYWSIRGTPDTLRWFEPALRAPAPTCRSLIVPERSCSERRFSIIASTQTIRLKRPRRGRSRTTDDSEAQIAEATLGSKWMIVRRTRLAGTRA
jgi:hypothetical protein